MSILTRITITLSAEHDSEEADRLLGLLSLHVAHGWQEEALPTGELRHIVHSTVPAFCHELVSCLAAALPRAEIRLDVEKENDWVAEWKNYFTPVRAGSRFLVLAPWMQDEMRKNDAEGRALITIEPKNAFGTGHHATTALCLTAISQLHEQGRILAGMRFLDLGTGSGILGLGLAKLGLYGDGLDVDVIAVDNALENRALNGLGPEQFNVRRGSIEEAASSYDLVVANILAEPLKRLAPDISSVKNPQGGQPLLILSGLLAVQADTVEAAYTAIGWPAARRMLQDGEWVALVFGE